MSIFDWREQDVVLHHRGKTAVHETSSGQIAIRQEDFDISEDDIVVVIDAVDVEKLCQALRKVKEEMGR